MSRSVLFVFLLVAVAFATDAADSDVLVLTQANFDDTIKANSLILVEFYAPWCGHCKQLAPEYEKAATAMKGKVPLGKVDATEEKDLGTRFEIRGFPTIKLFRDGVPSDYEGGRKAEDIVAYLKRQSGPASKLLASAEDVEEFKKEDDLVVIGFFSGSVDPKFTAQANKLRENYDFAEVTDAAVAAAVGATVPSVVIFRSFDEPKIVVTGDLNDLGDFIKQYNLPLVGELGPENFQDYRERGLPLFWNFIDLSDSSDDAEYLATLRTVALATQGKLSVVYLDSTKYGRQAESVGLSGKKFPAAVILDSELEKKYVYPETEELTADKISAFVNKFLAGEIAPTIKSEEIPESNAGPVKVVVAKQFEEIVFSGKNVFIEFYAPWCGHCKKLAPVWEELAEAFKGNNDIVIAKMDATANDIPAEGFEVQGFPTLMFIKAGSKTPEKYGGGRTLADLKSFVEKHVGAAAAVHDDEL